VARVAATLLVAVAGLTACGGSDKPDAYARENAALLARVPVYPGASAPSTNDVSSGDTKFSARDWTLPARVRASAVIDRYEAQLQARGWKVSGRSFDTIRATRGNDSLSVGVRGRRLEVVANSRGA
jgi:hypothetical protein